jgi:DNA-binding transcriptional regulator YiaG
MHPGASALRPSGEPHGGRKEGCSKAGSDLEKLRDAKKDQSMGKFAKEPIESMQQAAKHAADKRVRGLRLSKVEVPDVKAIRLSLRMSQHHFAAAYRIPLPTLKN